MEANWQKLGVFNDQFELAEALNRAGVGVGAIVGVGIGRTHFTVFCNDKSVVLPGYEWRVLGGSSTGDDLLCKTANEAGAVSAVAALDPNGGFILWGYAPPR